MSTSTTQLLEKDKLKKAHSPFKQGGLFNDELKVLNFLKSNEPQLVSSYMSSLEKGRQGILRRLAGSMLREDIMG